jgi:hypothetical protein
MMNYEFFCSPLLFDNGQEATDTIYSDRLYMWDSQKHDQLCEKHFGNKGQYWSNRKPESVEAFLRDYLGEDGLILCRIEQQKNVSTGYPVWRFDFKKATSS